jgi:hypothetical protein
MQLRTSGGNGKVPDARFTALDALSRALKEGFVKEGPTLVEIPLSAHCLSIIQAGKLMRGS